MSSILLKIDFTRRTHLSQEMLTKISTDILDCISDEDFFKKSENVFMNYKIAKSTNFFHKKKLN
jgi:hypothetical protein